MPDIRRHRVDPASIPPRPQHGFVSTAPASAEDELEVVLPEFSTRHIFQIRRWMPRGEDLPKVNDEVLVVKDDRGEPWVVAWWPL